VVFVPPKENPAFREGEAVGPPNNPPPVEGPGNASNKPP